MNDGNIIEQGSHDELMSVGGFYASCIIVNSILLPYYWKLLYNIDF